MTRSYVKRTVTGLLAGLLLICAVVPSTAFAADKVDRITLSPVDKHYKLKPGETKKDSFTVINDGDNAYSFSVYARPYSIGKTDDSYAPNFTMTAPNADVYQWIQFEKSSYTLKAGQNAEVNYTVRVPQNATPGGHYGVLFAETQPTEKVKGNAITRKKRLGLIVYTTVAGTFKTSGTNEGISIPFFQLQPPVTALQRVVNTGNSDFTVTGTMNVYDAFGNKKFQVTKDYTLLPDTVRKMPFEWANAPWFGLYKVELTTKYLKTMTTKTSYVLVSPLWVYVVLGIVIAARILYALSQRKKLHSKPEATETAKETK